MPSLRVLGWLPPALAALLFLPGLGTRDFWAPDEPRLGMVTEEMRSMRHGPEGLLLLHLSGEPYTQKPPLYHWLATLASVPAERVSEWAARIPSALAGVAVVFATQRLGARWLGGASGFLGAMLLLSTFSFAEHARRAQYDIVLTLFEWIALVAFAGVPAGRHPGAGRVALLHGAMGLAVLTKGPVGCLVPLFSFALYLGWEGRLRDLRAFVPPWALLLSVGPSLAWIAAAIALAPPGFFAEAVVENLFGRFLAGTSHARPIYYYLYQFPLEFVPWTLLWPLLWWAGRWRVFVPRGGDAQRQRAWRLLLAWVGAALLFFSISAGKRGLYLFPVFPAMALLCADALLDWLRHRRSLPRWLSWSAAGLGSALVAILVLRPGWLPVPPPAAALPAAAALVAAGIAIGWVLGRRGADPRWQIGILVGVVLGLEGIIFWVLFPSWNPARSPRPLAVAVAALADPGERIGLADNHPKLGGLAYYSGHDVAYLGDAESLRRFLATGGRWVVVRSDKLHRVREVTTTPVREQHGRWLIVGPAAADVPGPRELAPP